MMSLVFIVGVVGVVSALKIRFVLHVLYRKHLGTASLGAGGYFLSYRDFLLEEQSWNQLCTKVYKQERLRGLTPLVFWGQL